jgi:ABC-type glycerol-3-phosphate transport system substrate-binding protein
MHATRSQRMKKMIVLGTVIASTFGLTSIAAPATAANTTISVALAAPPLPPEMLAEFTKATGITVKWTQVDWDSLQTKIAAAAIANTYFADATDVDWSRVGQLGKLNWFMPMEKYLNTSSMLADMPQLSGFAKNGHVIGIPWDASFMVTTVNKAMFAKAKIAKLPKTIAEYTKDLQTIKAKGIAQYPLNIPFAAAEGLSTYWYQTANAFGGKILDGAGKPLFVNPASGGYKAAVWMIDAMKNGLVPPGNINVADSQGQQTLMAKGKVASTFSDYSGNVGTLYDVPASSSVVRQVQYLPTPGILGPVNNLGNPDGIGIPKQARNAAAAAKFITWFTNPKNMADFAGATTASRTWSGYFIPSRLSGIAILNKKGSLIGGDVLTSLLKTSGSVFPQGAPAWYPQFSSAVNTNLHSAAAGTITVQAAIKAIAAIATKLSSGK